jgi:deoxyribose-phosphate aldolase
MNAFSSVELAFRVDAALWKPAATVAEIGAFCTEVRKHKFRAVCVNSSRVELASARLENSGVQVVALIGFPLGAMEADAKRYETEVAVDHGAQEIEVVLNLGWLKDGAQKPVLRELRDVVEAADERPVCAVIETTQLTRDEISAACHLILESGAKAVSTGADFWPDTRAAEADVKLLREVLGPDFAVKAAGGIRDAQTALALLDAGATRIGSTDPGSLWQSLHTHSG